MAHSLSELELWEAIEPIKLSGANPTRLEDKLAMRQVLDRTRQRTFAALCSWERQLSYASINESIFSMYQRQVDQLLAEGAPEFVEQFTAVYRRLREAADSNPAQLATEVLSRAITTCRRTLKAVVDHVFPPTSEKSADGHVLDDAHHRNRLMEFVKQKLKSSSDKEVTIAMIEGLYDRFLAVDTLTNKAVHAAMALEIANLCAINTYIISGEILRLSKP